MLVAITRRVSPEVGQCELTHVLRQSIDVERASRQHRQYELELVNAGCDIDRLPAEVALPDSVFVEDTAVVLDEIAVITRPGVESRRDETQSIAAVLSAYRPLVYIEAPGTLDGGDVLQVGRRLFVGEGQRSNAQGVAQLRRLVRRHDYEVIAVQARNCLHLKSAACCPGGEVLLVDPDWTDPSQFPGCEIIEIDKSEPGAANVLEVNGVLLYPKSYPRTGALLTARNYPLRPVDLSELSKAEGAVTCCSLVFRRQP